jgi:murein DD-endopeptidase MepM/ murein hydrolase activator NlpD
MIIAALVLFLIGAFSIYYLSSSMEEIADKREEVQQEYSKLRQKHFSLQQEVELKEEALTLVEDKLEDIEQLIGMGAPLENSNLLERLDLAKLGTKEVTDMFQYIPNGWPVKNTGITSPYGFRVHPKYKKQAFHRGIDLRAKMKTPVFATADGIVEFAGKHRHGFGYLVILQHNYGFKTYYAHLSKKMLVKPGDFIKRGQQIALSGNSGVSNGPHLHYEVRFIQRTLNPYNFMKWNMHKYKSIFTKETRVPWQSLLMAVNHRKSTQTRP